MRSRCYVCREDLFNLAAFYNPTFLTTIKEKWLLNKDSITRCSFCVNSDRNEDVSILMLPRVSVSQLDPRCVYATTSDPYIPNLKLPLEHPDGTITLSATRT